MSVAATGGLALYGIRPEIASPTRGRSVGHLKPDVTVLAAPGAPTVTEHTNGPKVFIGAGLNDITIGGTYTTPTIRQVIQVEWTATGTPDVFKYRVAYGPKNQDGTENWGSYVTSVNATGTPQTITGGHGRTITVAATTGHTVTNVSTFTDSAELLTGDYEYVVCRGRRMGAWGFLTVASVSDTVTVAAKAIAVALDGASWTGADFLAIFRSLNGGPLGLSWVLWDSSQGTSFVDDLPDSKVNFDCVPPTYNETGKNGGFVFIDKRGITSLPSFSTLDTDQLTGEGIASESLAGPVDTAHQIKDVLSTGYMGVCLASMLGKPEVETVNAGAFAAAGGAKDEPTERLTYTPPAAGAETPVSFAEFIHLGGSPDTDEDGTGVWPVLFLQSMCHKINIKVAKTEIAEATADILSASFGVVGFPVATLAGGSTQDSVPVFHGVRTDDNADTDDLYLKRTTAPAAGTGDWQVKLGSGSYGNTVSVPYAGAGNRQTQAANRFSDKAYLSNGTGIPLGLFGRPVSFILAGDHEDGASGDVFQAPPYHLIPGEGSTPGTPDGVFTGFPPVDVKSSIGSKQQGYTSAHVTLSVDGVVQTIDDFEIEIERKREVFMPHGMESMAGVDVTPATDDSRAAIKITIQKRHIDRRLWLKMARHQAVEVTATIEGYPVLVRPGVYSQFSEGYAFSLPFARPKENTTTGGEGALTESVTFGGEKVRFSITEVSAAHYDLAA